MKRTVVLEQETREGRVRVDAGEAYVLDNGEIELHLNSAHIGRGRLLIEVERDVTVVMCRCGLAIYDGAAAAGMCLDCQQRERLISASKRKARR